MSILNSYLYYYHRDSSLNRHYLMSIIYDHYHHDQNDSNETSSDRNGTDKIFNTKEIYGRFQAQKEYQKFRCGVVVAATIDHDNDKEINKLLGIFFIPIIFICRLLYYQ